MTVEAQATHKRQTYKSKYKPTWCPGCGDFSVLAALDKALEDFGVPEHEIAIVSGIGCSSRFPFFMNTYGFQSAHGRALSVATGLKTARPDLTVIATGGDGDALAIGGNHFFHTMRRNVDLTYILMDNQTYGMTKGQYAPTTRQGTRTKSSPYGVVEAEVDPCWAALTMGATFVAQGLSAEPRTLRELLLKALRHSGIALVNVLSPCVTFNKGLDNQYFKDNSYLVPEDHDPSDFGSALTLLREAGDQFPIGLIYQTQAISFNDGVDAMVRRVREKGGDVDFATLAREFQ